MAFLLPIPGTTSQTPICWLCASVYLEASDCPKIFISASYLNELFVLSLEESFAFYSRLQKDPSSTLVLFKKANPLFHQNMIEGSFIDLHIFNIVACI